MKVETTVGKWTEEDDPDTDLGNGKKEKQWSPDQDDNGSAGGSLYVKVRFTKSSGKQDCDKTDTKITIKYSDAFEAFFKRAGKRIKVKPKDAFDLDSEKVLKYKHASNGYIDRVTAGNNDHCYINSKEELELICISYQANMVCR